jgi:hypothetical protein
MVSTLIFYGNLTIPRNQFETLKFRKGLIKTADIYFTIYTHIKILTTLLFINQGF